MAAREDGPLIGQVVGGRYRVVGLVGTGAMATIYRAEQNRIPRVVALKVIRPEMVTHETSSARFHREARAASKLHHEGIVRVLDWGADGKVAYIAMELIEGEDLFELLDRNGRLDQARAARIVINLCDALTAAHDQGVVHRDLKPENIMLVPGKGGDERVKVLDFGIAKLMSQTDDMFGDDTVPRVLTRTGSAVGTPSHMAPEQARGEKVDGRTDIYACGVLMYEMLTGHLPFEGQSPLQVAIMQVRDAPRPPREHFPGIDQELERIVLRSLEKAPEARFQSAAELKRALLALLPKLDDGHVARRSSNAPRSQRARGSEPPPGELTGPEGAPPLPPSVAAAIQPVRTTITTLMQPKSVASPSSGRLGDDETEDEPMTIVTGITMPTSVTRQVVIEESFTHEIDIEHETHRRGDPRMAAAMRRTDDPVTLDDGKPLVQRKVVIEDEPTAATSVELQRLPLAAASGGTIDDEDDEEDVATVMVTAPRVEEIIARRKLGVGGTVQIEDPDSEDIATVMMPSSPMDDGPGSSAPPPPQRAPNHSLQAQFPPLSRGSQSSSAPPSAPAAFNFGLPAQANAQSPASANAPASVGAPDAHAGYAAGQGFHTTGNHSVGNQHGHSLGHSLPNDWGTGHGANASHELEQMLRNMPEGRPVLKPLLAVLFIGLGIVLVIWLISV